MRKSSKVLGSDGGETTLEDIVKTFNDLFWKCQTYFPNDSRFHHDNFGFTPLNVIYSAIEWYDKHLLEQRAEANKVLAHIGASWLTSKSKPNAKIDLNHYNLFERQLHLMFLQDVFNKDTVQCLKHAHHNNCIPPWVYKGLPFDLQEILELY